jgi:hypothetical protein
MTNDEWPPRRGQTVWIYYFNVQNREGGVTVGVYPRVFEKRIENYLEKHGERWVLLIPGKPHNQGYGTAFKPGKVFATEADANRALQTAVRHKINALEDALHAAMKGRGVS